MLFSLILFTACSGEQSENTTVSADVQSQALTPKSAPAKTPVNASASQAQSKAAPPKEPAKNIQVTDQAVQIQLPALKIESGVGTYCYLQEMPDLDVGMTGLKFAAGESVEFISIRGLDPAMTKVETGTWSSCGSFGPGVATVPLYEVVGVDLASSDGNLFSGFNWFSLPEKTAFAFPGTSLWLFEVQIQDGTKGELDISTSVSTAPKSSVEQWASVFEISMEAMVVADFESKCTVPQDINILSAFGHSEPTQGTWDVHCGKDEIFAVDAKEFDGDIPPLKTFKTAKSVEAGTDCTLKCSWGDSPGQMCEAFMVATSLEKPLVCIDGEIR